MNIAKSSTLFVLFLFIIFSGIGQRKSERIAEEFSKTKRITDTQCFKVKLNIATTYNTFFINPTFSTYNENIDIEPDSAYLIIKDSTIHGLLPYFGQSHSVLKSGMAIIVLNSKMMNTSIVVQGKQGRQSILYQFGVQGKFAYYSMKLNIQYDGTCNLFVAANNHPPISYLGQLYPLK